MPFRALFLALLFSDYKNETFKYYLYLLYSNHLFFPSKKPEAMLFESLTGFLPGFTTS